MENSGIQFQDHNQNILLAKLPETDVRQNRKLGNTDTTQINADNGLQSCEAAFETDIWQNRKLGNSDATKFNAVTCEAAFETDDWKNRKLGNAEAIQC